jgi:tRNA(fMet)-specific endonuclease VapC
LLFGVHRSSTEIGENALLGPMQVWPFDKAAAEKAARLHSDLISKNQDIGVKDILIAAICLVHSLPILTLNEKHFKRVPSLTVYTPTTLPL